MHYLFFEFWPSNVSKKLIKLDPSGETMTTGHGFPVPSPRYASRIRHLSGGTEHAEDAEDEESEQFGGAGSSSNIRQAIGHSFAFAGPSIFI